MADEVSFQDLMQHVRRGDEAAAAELLRAYEPALRRVVHVRLVDARMRRRFDVDDICQSVLASFFVRAALGQYELAEPADLLKLLATMARNKLADKARRPSMKFQADRRVPLEELPESAITAPGSSPSQHLVLQELVSEARRRLSPADRRLLELRDQGLEWEAIAVQVGDSPEALRKRLARARNLVAKELGLEEGRDE